MASVWNCNINRQGRQEPSETSTAKIAKDAKNCIFGLIREFRETLRGF